VSQVVRVDPFNIPKGKTQGYVARGVDSFANMTPENEGNRGQG